MFNNYLGSISEPDRMPLQRVYDLVGEIENKTLTITTCVRRCPGCGGRYNREWRFGGGRVLVLNRMSEWALSEREFRDKKWEGDGERETMY